MVPYKFQTIGNMNKYQTMLMYYCSHYLAIIGNLLRDLAIFCRKVTPVKRLFIKYDRIKIEILTSDVFCNYFVYFRGHIRSDELICQGTRILNWGVRKELLINVSTFQKLTENIQSDELEC